MVGKKQVKATIRSYIINFKIHCISVALFALGMWLITYLSHRRLIIDDPLYKIAAVITEEQVQKNKAIGYPVKTGVLLTNFDEFDLLKNKFILDCNVWFSFNKKKVDIEKINKFSFGNAKVIDRLPVKVIDLDNDEVFVIHQVRISLKGNLKYYNYPFDDHRLFLVINNIFLNPKENILYGNNNNFEISKNLFVKNLFPVKKYVYFGYDMISFDKEDSRKQIVHPEVVFALDFKQTSFRNVEVVILPLLILLLIILLSFLLPLTKVGGRITFIFTALSGLLIYRFVIEEMMPSVGYYTVIDKMFTATLMTCVLVLVLQSLFIGRGITFLEKEDEALVERENRLNRMRLINGIVFYLTIGFLAIWIGLILSV